MSGLGPRGLGRRGGERGGRREARRRHRRPVGRRHGRLGALRQTRDRGLGRRLERVGRLRERDGVVGHEEDRREHDRGDRALAAVALGERDGRAEAVGEAAHHEEAEALRADRVGRGAAGDLGVRLGELLVGHAETVVADRHDDAALVLAGRDLDRRVRLGEHRRVLEELREQVGRVERVVPEHERVDVQVEAHAVVQLDLGRRRTDDVGDRHRLAHPTARVDAREDEERLGVAAHTGREVVEPEEVRQRARVLLGALELVEERELAVEEDLVAAGDVDEHLGDRAAERRLLAGDLHGRGVDVVERRGEAADLVARLDRDLHELDRRRLAGHRHLLDHLRQALAHLGRGVRQAPQRRDDAAGDEDREHEGQDHDAERDAGGDEQALPRRGREAGRELRGLAPDVVAHGTGLLDPLLREGGPLARRLRVDRVELAREDRGADVAERPGERRHDLVAGDPVQGGLGLGPERVARADQ
ncbi:hypothetical protein L600_004900000070 [Isoptericola variabilis J7]|nr:hypothetical protein L600_004900000070 [Isoptericola variabilis J7]